MLVYWMIFKDILAIVCQYVFTIEELVLEEGQARGGIQNTKHLAERDTARLCLGQSVYTRGCRCILRGTHSHVWI